MHNLGVSSCNTTQKLLDNYGKVTLNVGGPERCGGILSNAADFNALPGAEVLGLRMHSRDHLTSACRSLSADTGYQAGINRAGRTSGYWYPLVILQSSRHQPSLLLFGDSTVVRAATPAL